MRNPNNPADVGLDRQHRRLPGRQRLQRSAGAMHLIADAADVEDHEVLAVGIDQAPALPIMVQEHGGRVGGRFLLRERGGRG